MASRQAEGQGGLGYGLVAYVLWGVVPLYFRAVRDVPPAEILAHRVVWSLVVLAAVLAVFGRWRDLLRCLRDRRTVGLLCTSAVLVAVNWLVYIYGVCTNQVLQTSLGYFINPLFSVLLGLVVFRERLRPWQWVAVALAAAGIVHRVVAAGELPWIALAVAGSFGLYGLVRKLAPVDGLLGLSVETLVLFPVAAGALLYWSWAGAGALGRQGAGTDGLLLLSGVVTTVPLLCFGQAARRLRLSTLGFLQYVAPSMQLLLAVYLFREPFGPQDRAAFACTWLALAIFSADSVLVGWRPAAEPAEVPG